MALDNRADVVTTMDDGDLDDSGDTVAAGAKEANGALSSEAAAVDGGPERAAAADEPATANGASRDDSRPTRSGRKRTARQRALLVAGDAEAVTAAPPGSETVDGRNDRDASPAPVDPLLAGGGDEEWPVDAGASVLPPATTAAAAAAAAMYAPSPSRTAPIPVVAPAPTSVGGNGQPETQVALEPVPSPPVAVVPPPPRPRRRARPRVRKVTRVVRSVDAWSVFKVALIFFVAMGVVLITAGVLLWNLAQSTGTLDNVEGFFREAFGYDTFELQSEPLFRAGLTLTVLFVIAATGLTVVMAVLFNLIADLTGGIRLTVLEREVIARDDAVRKRRRRRPPRVAKPVLSPVSDLPAPPPLESTRRSSG